MSQKAAVNGRTCQVLVLSKQFEVLWQCFMCDVLYLVCPASRLVGKS